MSSARMLLRDYWLRFIPLSPRHVALRAAFRSHSAPVPRPAAYIPPMARRSLLAPKWTSMDSTSTLSKLATSHVAFKLAPTLVVAWLCHFHSELLFEVDCEARWLQSKFCRYVEHVQLIIDERSTSFSKCLSLTVERAYKTQNLSVLAHGFQQTHVKLLGAISDILIKSSFIARFQQISCKGIPFMTIFVPR
jgi:hypothetical protein